MSNWIGGDAHASLPHQLRHIGVGLPKAVRIGESANPVRGSGNIRQGLKMCLEPLAIHGHHSHHFLSSLHTQVQNSFVDISTGADQNRSGTERTLFLQQRRQGQGTGALQRQLSIQARCSDRLPDAVLRDCKDVIHIFFNVRIQVFLAGFPYNCIRHRGTVIQRHQLALPTGFHIDSRPCRHHTIDLDGGLQRLHGQSDPRDEAAAPDGHHDLLYLGALVQNLQGNGPLAAHSIPVRGGVHIVQMLFFCQLTGRDEGLVICRADFHQIGPQCADAVLFDLGR
ncbi:Lipopolysaccharide export system ATP-binding protein LptB, partial [Dysosmobacter welbionis]